MSDLVPAKAGNTLVELDEAKRHIALAREMALADELHEWRDRAAAMLHYSKMRGDSQEAANQAAEIKVRAEAALGALDREARPHGTNEKFRGDTQDVTPHLGVAPTTRANWRKLGELDEAKLDEVIASVRELDDTISTASVVRAISPNRSHVMHNSGENEWYTPIKYVEAARTAMGSIDLDPASNADANTVVRAERFYTVAENGLEQHWRGNVWMNPPYAQPLISQFSEKLVVELGAGNVTAACILVNNATETKWFQTLASASRAICFPAGRVKFWSSERTSAPLQGQAVLYAGKSTETFIECFADFGTVALLND
jgi:ParB family chromosome partitioning protein